eukprot:TRINITY_DN1410_c0_g3_i5.p1 TRINITY_DN1410_c0_g3~~TRINITY_DN1410_c0_g3_i5.p1  ORF type:complete len:162 (+),score=28.50 TRINITY_DN1410_c0_g3_i5:788-1273(+)
MCLGNTIQCYFYQSMQRKKNPKCFCWDSILLTGPELPPLPSRDGPPLLLPGIPGSLSRWQDGSCDKCVDGFVHHCQWLNNCLGRKNYFAFIMDGELIREILSNKSGQFEQVKISPIVKFLITGLVTHEGKKWVNHKRIISPAFHLQRLKGAHTAHMMRKLA